MSASVSASPSTDRQRVSQPTDSPRPWRDWLLPRMMFTDVVVIVWAVFGSQLAWFGITESKLVITGRLAMLSLNYSIVSLAVVLLWIVALAAYQTRSVRLLGSGSEEYWAVTRASLVVFGVLAIVSYLGKVELARGYFLMALPIGLVALLLSRWMWRKFVAGKRSEGLFGSRVVVVGTPRAAALVVQRLVNAPDAGYFVTGVCVDQGVVGAPIEGCDLTVSGNVDDVLAVMDANGADTVVVTSSRSLTPKKLRNLSWGLEPGRRHLIMASTLVDVAGPRIRTRPVAGLPLIHVETPTFSGTKLVFKRAFDLVTVSITLLVLSPLLAAIAVLVKLTSPGPVLFRQGRIGLRGESFTMLKFRSMIINADQQVKALASQTDAGNTVMFKMKHDPRVTRVGRVLRRFSLDELPQLINVLKGNMSLVGPRPPLPREVENFDSTVLRKFLVKPGITGLWQVSGRSDLSWEETVRLDLYYVENWSLIVDLQILFRTVKAVFARDGAY